MNEKLRFKKFMFWDLPEAPKLINHVGIWTQACLAPTPSTLEIFCNLASVPQMKKDSQNLKNLNPKLKENKYFKELSLVESKNSPTGSVQSKPSLSKQLQAAGCPTPESCASCLVRRGHSGNHGLWSPALCPGLPHDSKINFYKSSHSWGSWCGIKRETEGHRAGGGEEKSKGGKDYHSPFTKECESVAGQQREEKQLTTILASAVGLQFKKSNTCFYSFCLCATELHLDKLMFSTSLFIFTFQLADFISKPLQGDIKLNWMEKTSKSSIIQNFFFFFSKINTGGVFNHYNLQW